MDNTYKDYLEDCLDQLIDRGIEAREKSNLTKDDFDKGRSLGYYEVVDFLLNQAEIFGIKQELKEKIKTFSPSL